LIYDELFADSFVIDRPKDVVSGDFHWVHRIDEHTCYVAAADCTGHGLPGAMMAAIGCSVLNEVIPQHATLDPAELLGLLHTRLVAVLHQQGKGRGAGDGMDVALCRVDRRNNEILFAGAFRPLYWLHQGQLSVINGDRRPVGGAHLDGDRRFTCHRLAYTAGDRIYLFSDGYVDQFGGPDRKRFMTSRLHDLIAKNQHLPMKEQAVLFDRTFLDWKGNEEQMDDVSMLGLAV
jgi:serine phosphatase RsbU (regulator of sigma subunit)